VAVIDELQPALAIVDVRLPEWTGLEVVERIRHQPEIVFATAYDEYAVGAFELGALDYLVKPFGRQRFEVTLDRVRRRLMAGGAGPSAAERARSALKDRPLRRLFARQGEGIVPIATDAIVRIQARGDYAEVYAPGGPFLLHVSLAELAATLDPDRFAQVHRSHIVSVDAIQRLVPHVDDRRLVLVLTNGDEVVASRTASEQLRRQAR
jgi:two-component system LytT family response regulator